jgi:TetR/AcrR family transcriptional regulator, lmrAB and yxaGH operons repressor
MSTAPLKPEDDTRSRILRAAGHLFRKRGYHGTGLNDILELAQAPKGSMYHHFPGGKQAIGVAVIERIAADIMTLFAASRARSTEALVRQVGAQMADVVERTNHEICALYAAFLTERVNDPELAQAVSRAYVQMTEHLAKSLTQDGMNKRLSGERASLIVSLLEGGSLVAMAHQDTAVFKLAVKQAAELCKITD